MGLSFRPVESNIDVRTQAILHSIKSKSGGSNIFLSAKDEKIPVTARVTDVNEWESNSFIDRGTAIKVSGKDEEDLFLVTGRVVVDCFEDVKKKEYVKSIQAAESYRSVVRKTLEDIGITNNQLPIEFSQNEGEGVLVGIIDYGADFTHELLRNADGSTKFEFIWDQNADPVPDDDERRNELFDYGKVYHRAKIQKVLEDTSLTSQTDKYRMLGYDPSPGNWPSHGTHVAGIISQIAPKASIGFVDISIPIPETPEESLESSLADSAQLIEAARYIFEKAGERQHWVKFKVKNIL